MIAKLKEESNLPLAPELLGRVYEENIEKEKKWRLYPWTIHCSQHGHVNIHAPHVSGAEHYMKLHFEHMHPNSSYAIEVNLVTPE